MAGRLINTYYDIDRNRWCGSSATPLLERFYPWFNTYETPVFVINLINADADPVEIPLNSTFSLSITDADYTPIATPTIGGVNQEEDYEDVDPENGIFSFRMNFATQEAIDLMEDFRHMLVYVNLNITDTSSNVINFSAPSVLNKVYKSDVIIPISPSSQYRINPNDGATDIWDYGTSSWMRAVLVNGVLNYYEAP